jgi:RHS repeat-associated protein
VAHYENGETYFMHANSIGATAFVTDYTGAIVQDELHYPWGQEWTMQGTVEEERFASLQHRDSETSLDPTHFRMYSSGQYRWFTPDPLQAHIFNPQSMSRYSYAGGNATNLTDPAGLFAYCPYGETNNQCNPPPDSQYYMNLSYYEWSCMINNCMLYGGLPTVSGGGGGAPAPAPKPAPPAPPKKPTPVHTIGTLVVVYLCGRSPQGAVLSWMETGLTKGAAFGAYEGAVSGAIFGVAVGAVPGALLGGFTGGAIGAGGGALWGAAAAGYAMPLGFMSGRSTYGAAQFRLTGGRYSLWG